MSRLEEIVAISEQDFDGLADLRSLVDPISLALVGAWAGFRGLPRSVNGYPASTIAHALWEIGFLLAEALVEQDEERGIA